MPSIDGGGFVKVDARYASPSLAGRNYGLVLIYDENVTFKSGIFFKIYSSASDLTKDDDLQVNGSRAVANDDIYLAAKQLKKLGTFIVAGPDPSITGNPVNQKFVFDPKSGVDLLAKPYSFTIKYDDGEDVEVSWTPPENVDTGEVETPSSWEEVYNGLISEFSGVRDSQNMGLSIEANKLTLTMSTNTYVIDSVASEDFDSDETGRVVGASISQTLASVRMKRSYFGIVTTDNSEATIREAAAYAYPNFLYGSSFNDSDSFVDGRGIGHKLKGMYRFGFLTQYSKPKKYPQATWMSERLSQLPGSKTWNYVRGDGLDPDEVGDGELTVIRSKNMNVFTSVADRNMFVDGVVTTGDKIDDVVASVWAAELIKLRFFELVTDETTDIGFDKDGYLQTINFLEKLRGELIGKAFRDFRFTMPPLADFLTMNKTRKLQLVAEGVFRGKLEYVHITALDFIYDEVAA